MPRPAGWHCGFHDRIRAPLAISVLVGPVTLRLVHHRYARADRGIFGCGREGSDGWTDGSTLPRAVEQASTRLLPG